MIVSLEGKFVAMTYDYVEVVVGGVGYGLSISRHTYEQIGNVKEGRLFTHQQLSDKGQFICGFSSLGERKLFQLLISVAGVGPSLALMVLSTYSPRQLQGFIQAKEVSRLQQVKGVGKKTAQRIVLELSDKVAEVSGLAEEKGQGVLVDEAAAVEALMALGVGRAVAQRSVRQGIEELAKEGAKKPELELLLKRALAKIEKG